MNNSAKIQRWIDLLAALLSRRFPISFDDIAREVPAYATGKKDAVKRMFERDKKELRTFGVRIETIGDDGDEATAYQLKARDFYLPYLALVTPRGKSAAKRPDRYGYHSLEELAFEADELEALAEGASRARQLGSAPLTDDVDSAIRKLAFDLPLGAVSPGETVIVEPKARPDSKTLQVLGDALHARRHVRLTYAAPGTDAITTRTVEPYGLFFLNSHWYLAARDVDKDAIRNFRVSRIRTAKPTSADKALPDYTIPPLFKLHEHARSRQAWELGDADVVEAIVEFAGANGVPRGAALAGEPVAGSERRRRFQVRRGDAFVRWLLSFAGDATPVSPPEIVAEFSRQIEATRAMYQR